MIQPRFVVSAAAALVLVAAPACAAWHGLPGDGEVEDDGVVSPRPTGDPVDAINGCYSGGEVGFTVRLNAPHERGCLTVWFERRAGIEPHEDIPPQDSLELPEEFVLYRASLRNVTCPDSGEVRLPDDAIVERARRASGRVDFDHRRFSWFQPVSADVTLELPDETLRFRAQELVLPTRQCLP